MNRFSASILTLALLAVPAASLSAAEQPAPQGLPAEVIQVEPRVLERTLEAVGSLRANEAVTIRPEQTGLIEAIHFQEGQTVKQGDRLFSLEASTYRAQLEQAKAGENLSQIEYNQAEQLLKKKLGSQHSRDTALAQLQIDRAKSNLARTQLDKMTIHAPFSGQTGLREVSAGDYVNNGDSLVELVDIRRIKADFKVAEIYLPQLRLGQPVSISVDAFPGETFEGEIYAMAPQVDVRGRSLALRARIPNDQGRLRPGLFARMTLTLERKEAALMVPEQAIVPQGQRQLVYKVVEGKISPQPVSLGLRQRGEVEVLTGLKAGDVIVTAGQLKLRPGAPVTPLFPKPDAAPEPEKALARASSEGDG